MKDADLPVLRAVYEIVGDDLGRDATTSEVQSLLPADLRAGATRQLKSLADSHYLGEGADKYNIQSPMLDAVRAAYHQIPGQPADEFLVNWDKTLLAIDKLAGNGLLLMEAGPVGENLGLSQADFVAALDNLIAHRLLDRPNAAAATQVMLTPRGQSAAQVLDAARRTVVR